MVRYVHPGEELAVQIKRGIRAADVANTASGTEKLRTAETAVAAWDQSEFAKQLAEQLEGELGPLPGQIQSALGESAAALAEAGLARSDAATAVSDAQSAVAEAEQAILDAAAASGAASVADGKAAAAQVAAQSALADAEAALARAGVSDVFIQGTAPRANLAPSIKGDGTYAEVRRNSFPNPGPRTTAGIIAISVNTPTPTLDMSSGWVRVTCNTTETHATTPRTQVVTTIGAASVTAGATATLKVEVRNSSGRNMRVDAWFMTAAGVYVSYIAYAVTGLVAGEWKQLHYTPTVPAGAALMGYQIIQPSNVTPTVPGEWFEYRNLSTDPGGYFDGNTTPATAQGVDQPEDFRWRWLGTANASGSVMEIERVAGLTGVNAIAGVSAKAGRPAVRIIPTGISENSGAWFPMPPGDARTLATAIGTIHMDAPLTGVLSPTARTIAAESPYAAKAPQAPNLAGSYPLRGEVSGLSSSYLVHLRHGGTLGSGDVWWTDIGLFAGDYDGPNLVMENILWIDTTGGANTPKRWNGSAWAAITDKVAVDAAAAAVAAQTKADSAFDEAVDAATAAGNAQVSADGKNRVWYQGTAPAGTGHKPGDTWFDTSNGNRVTQWDGDSWEATQFGTGAIATAAITNALIADATIQSAKIANLDAAKITTGTLDAARIAALSISTGHLAADAVTAAKIAALTITAAEIASNAVTAIKIAANAVTAEKINAGAVTTVKLDALAVTAEKIAAGAIIAEKIAAEAITTAKLAATAIDGMTITGALIRTAASGQRMQVDINGLRAFDASNIQRALLAASSGGLLLSGALTSYAGGNNPRAILSDGALTFDHVGSPGAGTATLGPSGIESTDSNSSLVVAKRSAAPGVGLTLLAGTGSGNTVAIDLSGATSTVNLVAPNGVLADGKLVAGDALRGGAAKMSALSVLGKAYDGLKFWRTDLNVEFIYRSGGWQPLQQSGNSVLVRAAAPADESYSMTITFPHAFSSVPNVQAVASSTTAEGLPFVAVGTITATGFTVNMAHNFATRDLRFNWLATV